MRLEQLIYCIEVANSKTFSQASKKLFVSQSTLSIAIQNLEDELEFQIFKRSRAGVLLTEKGERLLEKAKVIIAHVEALKKLSTSQAHQVEVVTIAAVPVGCQILTAELNSLIGCPQRPIALDLLELRPDKIIDTLIENQADIVIGSYSESTKGAIYHKAARGDLVIEPIYKDHMYAFIGRNHPKFRKKQVTISELALETSAMFDDCVLMEIDDTRFGQGDMMKNRYAFSDKTNIKKIVSRGMAYAILPSLMAYKDIYIESGWMTALPIVDVDVTLTMYIAYKDNEILSSEVKRMIDIIRQIYMQLEQTSLLCHDTARRSNINNSFLQY